MNTLLGLIGLAGNLIFNFTGMSKAEEQQQAALERVERGERFQRGVAIQQQEMQRKQAKEARQERQRAWKFREEERDYGRSQAAMGQFISVLGQNPTAKRQLKQIWGS